jgi:hypothetical protein
MSRGFAGVDRRWPTRYDPGVNHVAWTLLIAATQLLPPAAERAKLPREEQEKLIRAATPEELLAEGRVAVAGLGLYRVLLVKQERIGGKLQDPHVLRVTVREQPFAIRLESEAGEARGRKVLYDSQNHPGELRVREHGVLGWVGWISISANGKLARKTTNHPMTDVGFGALLRIQTDGVEAARRVGGYTRIDEGWNERGRWCIRYEAPANAGQLYAQRSRVCLDPVSLLPMETTVWDAQGLLETYVYSELVPNVPGGEASLKP